MLIFVYHKIQIVRDADPTITSNFEALKKLLFAPGVYEHMPIEGLENVEIADRNVNISKELKSSIDKESSSKMSGTSESKINDSKYSMYDGLSLESPSTGSDAKATTMQGKRFNFYEKNEIIQAAGDNESMAGISFGDPSMTGMSFGNNSNLYQLNTLDEDDEHEA